MGSLAEAGTTGRKISQGVAGSESRVFECQHFETLHDVVEPYRVGVSERTSTEGGESSAEHHRQIHIFRLFCDAFLQAPRRFVDDGIDETFYDQLARLGLLTY